MILPSVILRQAYELCSPCGQTRFRDKSSGFHSAHNRVDSAIHSATPHNSQAGTAKFAPLNFNGYNKNLAPFPFAINIFRCDILRLRTGWPGREIAMKASAAELFMNENDPIPRRPGVFGRLRDTPDLSEAYSAPFSAPFSGNIAQEQLEIKELRRKDQENRADGGVAAWAGTTPVLGGLRAKTRSVPDPWRPRGSFPPTLAA
jgi:hypothetical protein